jgi:SSS family solute:Na+ symporter
MNDTIALHWIDWAIIGSYILFSLGVGLYFSRKAGKSTDEYFLSGRSLPWWIVGTSMVATTFAADTPYGGEQKF